MVGPPLVAGVAVDLTLHDERQHLHRDRVGQREREALEHLRPGHVVRAHLDRQRALDATGVAELFLGVASEQLGRRVVRHPVGQRVVEVLTAAFELEEQLELGDAQVVERSQLRSDRREVTILRHRPILSQLHPSANGVVGGNLDEPQLGTVGIGDPALEQSPGHPCGRLQHGDPRRDQPGLLGDQIGDLHPEAHAPSREGVGSAGELEVATTEEVDDPRDGPADPVLPKDRQAEGVLVEGPAPSKVGDVQDHPAPEDVHPCIIACAVGDGRWPPAGGVATLTW